ncbi:hypothetical protein HHK36_032770 [Tetracentron sinense]|uniref:Dynamin stalk domain-containing protein n=1 Tax=Tetracentron sinense TaxID=13715 RepID=A0A834Y4G2_TETSI|nr:hypothetical protein HHK36_032770 [Tetracentron sinense]
MSQRFTRSMTKALALAQAELEKEYPEDLPLALLEMEHEEAPADMSTMQALDNAREIHEIKGSITAIFESLKSLTMAQASNRPILQPGPSSVEQPTRSSPNLQPTDDPDFGQYDQPAEEVNQAPPDQPNSLNPEITLFIKKQQEQMERVQEQLKQMQKGKTVQGNDFSDLTFYTGAVVNRIGDESYEEARKEEAKLFQTHRLLSEIDKSIVGIPVLARNLVQIQANSISRCLPDIVKKINDKLNQNMSELKKMPNHLSSVADALTTFMGILGSVKESFRKIFIRGEFDEYPNDKEMHCTARLAEMLNELSKELQLKCENNDSGDEFLMEEIKVLEETIGIGLPNFLPRTAFLSIL